LSAVGGLQMNINSFITKDYRKKDDFAVRKSKPNQSQFPKGQNELKIACQKIWPHPKFSFIKAAIDFSVLKPFWLRLSRSEYL